MAEEAGEVIGRMVLGGQVVVEVRRFLRGTRVIVEIDVENPHATPLRFRANDADGMREETLLPQSSRRTISYRPRDPLAMALHVTRG